MKKTNWCLYLKGHTVVSDILECEPTMLENGSSITVQVSEDRTVLEKTIQLFASTKKKLTADVVEHMKKLAENKQWLVLGQEIESTTGEKLCCQGAIERFMSGL